VLLFLLAFTYGWTFGNSNVPVRQPSGFWSDVVNILSHNCRSLLGLVVASLLTIGMAGLWQVMLNGLAFGWAVGSAGASISLLFYAPLEVLAFALAAGAALRVSLHVVACLFHSTKMNYTLLRHCLQGALVACGILLPAAALEALAIHLR
jgi:hypothetical protein